MRRRRAVVALLALLLATGLLPVVAQAAPAQLAATRAAGDPVAQLAHCQRAGVPARCGSIRVPLDRTGATAGRVTIGFEYYPPRSGSTPTGVIVAAEGGPGYSTTASRAWYLDLFEPIMGDRALLLVDQRGTGLSDPIHCPDAQAYTGHWVRDARRCGRHLGNRSDLYTTAAASDDLAALLAHLHVGKVDLYGDSYGSFFAQTFTVRHPGLVRTLVVDGTYPIEGLDPWYLTTARMVPRNVTSMCADSRSTCPVAPSRMRALLGQVARSLRNHPVTTTAPGASGRRVTVRLTSGRLLDTLLDSDVLPGMVREIPAALVAFQNHNPLPLARLVAEVNGPSGGAPSLRTSRAGAVRDYSEGAYLAYACSDYPQVWDVAAGPQRRRSQWRDAVANLPAAPMRPFTSGEWAHSQFMVFNYCIGWPRPRVAEPPFPNGSSYPDLPTLVLNGGFDLRTDVLQAQEVARNFPGSTYVEVPPYGHVTALADPDRCVSHVVRRFVRTTAVTGTGCIADISEHRVVARFARRTAQVPEARVAGPRDRSNALDRRSAYTAVESVADVVDRWYAIPGYTGTSLYGGRFTMTTTSGRPFWARTWRLRLADLRWTSDLAVTGRGTIPRGPGRAELRLHVDGPGGGDGWLTLRWQARAAHAQVRVTGTLGGRPVRLLAPAPSFY